MKMKIAVLIIVTLLTTENFYSQELSGNIALETRLFTQSGLDSRQKGSGLSLSFKPELFYEWADGDQRVLFVPYFRYDQHDEERTHFDIRELYWATYSADWELRVGIRKIFWGVTESQHLVDVINQTDFVENLDGEDKLGQPMINFAYIQDWGTIDFFILPGFRERTFPGEKGRLRFPFIVNKDITKYEAGNEEQHIDFAARWYNNIGNFDIGISHFVGTSREPRYQFMPTQTGVAVQPIYDLMNQTGIDVLFVDGAWIWKLETISRHAREKRFYALTGGFEYTFSNINNSGIDIGVIGEYLFDDRDQNYFSPNPFKNHVFVGSRLAFNDIQSTEILAGGIINYRNGSTFLNVEASRRIGESFKLNVEFRGMANIDEYDFFYGFRKDSYLQAELEWYY